MQAEQMVFHIQDDILYHINTVLYLIKVTSNTIEPIVHTLVIAS